MKKELKENIKASINLLKFQLKLMEYDYNLLVENIKTISSMEGVVSLHHVKQLKKEISKYEPIINELRERILLSNNRILDIIDSENESQKKVISIFDFMKGRKNKNG